jgi:hypothetical protein
MTPTSLPTATECEIRARDLLAALDERVSLPAEALATVAHAYATLAVSRRLATMMNDADNVLAVRTISS